MNNDLLQRRLGWLGMVATIIVCGALAQGRVSGAQDQGDPPSPGPQYVPPVPPGNPQPPGSPAPPAGPRPFNIQLNLPGFGADSGKFWLGIEVHEADPALRAQLGLEERQGLVVGGVAADSPAEKAGIKRHDVLTDAGGAKLGRVRDLAAAVESAGANELSLKLLRGGKHRTILVTPVERGHDTVRFFGPPGMGMVFSGGVGPRPELPDNVKIIIQREGKKPASISIQRGDEKWEITDEELSKLPDDVRQIVAPLVVGMPMMMPLGGNAPQAMGGFTFRRLGDESLPPGAPRGPDNQGPRPFNIPVPPPGQGGSPNPGAGPPGLGGPEGGPGISVDVLRRLDEMSRRMDQLRDEIRGLREGRTAGPQHDGGPPAGPRGPAEEPPRHN